MAKSWIPIVLILVGVYLVTSGIIDLGSFGKTTSGSTIQPTTCPSDLKTTITLNTKDGLASTATDANVSYYVFKDTGEYLKSGTTATGTTSFDVECGKNFKLIAYDDDDSSTDYYPVETAFSSDGGGEGSLKTININLNKEGGAKIQKLRDPVDLDENITTALGATSTFEIVMKENVSSAAFKDLGIILDVNSSSTQDVEMPGFDEISCPKRLTTSTQRKKFCFSKVGDILSSDGIKTFQVSVKFSSSSSAATADGVTVWLMDKSMFKDPEYVTEGISGFHTDYEDTNDATNVGAPDSDSYWIQFNG